MKLIILIALGLCIIVPIKVQAQQTKHSVIISRETKKPISSVRIRITQNEKVIALETNQDGVFWYPLLENGRFRVDLEKKSYQINSIELRAGSFIPDTIRLNSAISFNPRYASRYKLLEDIHKTVELKFGGSSCYKSIMTQLNSLKSDIKQFQNSIEKEEREWKEHEQFILNTDNKINDIENNIKNSLGTTSYKQKIEKAEAKWISNCQIQISIKKQLDTGCYPLNKNWVLRTQVLAFESQQLTYFSDSITRKTEVSFSVQRGKQDTTYTFRPIFNRRQNLDNLREFTVYLLGNSPIDTLKILPVQNDRIRNNQSPKENKQSRVLTKNMSSSQISYRLVENEPIDRKHILGKYVHIVGTKNWTFKELPRYYEIQKVTYIKQLPNNYKPAIQILIDDNLYKKILIDEETLKSPTHHLFELPPLNSFLISYKPDSLNIVQKIDIVILDKNREKQISQTLEGNNIKGLNTPPDSTVGGFLLKIKTKHKNRIYNP
ncbi:hypothetical protein VB264_15225 [Arcicella aquatica]|uniref:Carboxypeptidase regulatory-like domain-containing protein n=1 Tax=Arcicella aquatica TaxID=217141 RepID=A0ABU5QPY3_9BACT|nr:hypothetical protein [Arcicella aquatica]MEA5259147.1 hypothetical protein [Arcicella aquatica]